MKKLLTGILIWWLFAPLLSFAGLFGGVIDDTLEGEAGEGKTLKEILQPVTTSGEPINDLRDFIAYIATQILLPLAVFGWIIVAIIGFYKLMSSDSDEEQKKWRNYLIWWVIGTVVMVSAWYIANQLVGAEGTSNIIWSIAAGDDRPAGAVIAEQVYTQIAFPLMRIFIFIVLGILFVSALINGLKYVTSADESVQKKSMSLVLYNAVGIMVIILAKTMVEAVYGPYSDVINDSVTAGGEDLGAIGKGIFENPDLSMLYLVINRILGLATFVVMVILVYQGYQLLFNPTSEEQVSRLKKSIVYIFIGIVIIGAGYLLTNFFIINQ